MVKPAAAAPARAPRGRSPAKAVAKKTTPPKPLLIGNRGALHRTLAALVEAGRLDPELDAALVAHCERLAGLADESDDEKVQREYRLALKDLREATANAPDSDDLAALISALRTEVGDTPDPEPQDARRADRTGRRAARPSADAVAAPRGGRRSGGRS